MQKKKLLKMEQENEQQSIFYPEKGAKIQIIEPNKATGGQGYATVLSDISIAEGTFYFEVHLKSLPENSNVRIGIEPLVSLEVPVGYTDNGYSYRCSDGNIFNNRKQQKYGKECYSENNVIGVLVHLGAIPPPILTDYQVNKDSYIKFFLNGQDLDIAFTKLKQVSYHAAVSIYNQATIEMKIDKNCQYKYPEGVPLNEVIQPDWDNSYFNY